MDFGISLDPLDVAQRHSLYDSESEEESEQEHQNETDVFTVDGRGEDRNFLAGRGLLLAFGSTASVFARSFVRLREEPFLSLQADASRAKRGTNFPRGKGAKNITHFQYTEEEDPKWIVCVHDTELLVEHCNHWAEKVFDHGQPSQVIVYVCQSLHEYFSASLSREDNTHVMRSLQSSTWPHPSLGAPLEPPNSLQGEPAAILTLCELRGIPCMDHILYASSSLTERERVLAFLPTFNQMSSAGVPLKDLPIRREKEGERLIKIRQPKPQTELFNLYT